MGVPCEAASGYKKAKSSDPHRGCEKPYFHPVPVWALAPQNGNGWGEGRKRNSGTSGHATHSF